MNKDFKLIKKEELLSFVKKIYEEGCYGHLDLIDNFCEKEVEEFFQKLPIGKIYEPVTKIDLNPLMPNFNYIANPEIFTNSSQVTITNNTTELL